jgi:hypothetical protein
MDTETVTNEMRWLWYILAAVGLAIALGLGGFYSRAPLTDRFDKWIRLAVYTAVVFGYLLKWGWRYVGSLKFWVLFLSFFIAHAAVCIFLFPSRSGAGSNLVLGLAGGSEIVLLAAVFAIVMQGYRRKAGAPGSRPSFGR